MDINRIKSHTLRELDKEKKRERKTTEVRKKEIEEGGNTENLLLDCVPISSTFNVALRPLNPLRFVIKIKLFLVLAGKF